MSHQGFGKEVTSFKPTFPPAGLRTPAASSARGSPLLPSDLYSMLALALRVLYLESILASTTLGPFFLLPNTLPLVGRLLNITEVWLYG